LEKVETRKTLSTPFQKTTSLKEGKQGALNFSKTGNCIPISDSFALKISEMGKPHAEKVVYQRKVAQNANSKIGN
jgi:hypothetical protein